MRMANGVTLPNERDLLRRYGLTLARYVEFLESQGGVCRVCGKPPHDGKPLVVDHEHTPPYRIWGVVHGSPCNRALTQQVRRYVRTPPTVEQYVPDELEAAAIVKREREKHAARARRAAQGKQNANGPPGQQSKQITEVAARLRAMTTFQANTERALAETRGTAPVGGTPREGGTPERGDGDHQPPSPPPTESRTIISRWKKKRKVKSESL